MSERQRYAEDRNRAAYYWEARRDGLVVASEFLPDGSHSHARFEDIARPFELHARPYRPSDFRAFAMPIEAGQYPIWEHFVTQTLPIGDGKEMLVECLFLGRRHPDGREDLVVVTPAGNPIPCGSVADARAAVREAVAAGATLFR